MTRRIKCPSCSSELARAYGWQFALILVLAFSATISAAFIFSLLGWNELLAFIILIPQIMIIDIYTVRLRRM